MTTDAFRSKSRALEDEYFRRVDDQLAQAIRDQWQHDRDIKVMKRESRIEDESVIEELLEAGIKPGMIRAMRLVPAVHVAWANGLIEKREREAVMQAAHAVGIRKESPTGCLLASWLNEPPPPELFQVWEDYVKALHQVLNSISFHQLYQNAVDTARDIAESAGGSPGVHAVTVAEQRAIQQVDESFSSCQC
ncbi:MAG: hypothetical protein ABGZ35_01180 [Planctomycetaceae bacterium]|jgi:hypothetical protein